MHRPCNSDGIDFAHVSIGKVVHSVSSTLHQEDIDLTPGGSPLDSMGNLVLCVIMHLRVCTRDMNHNILYRTNY